MTTLRLQPIPEAQAVFACGFLIGYLYPWSDGWLFAPAPGPALDKIPWRETDRQTLIERLEKRVAEMEADDDGVYG